MQGLVIDVHVASASLVEPRKGRCARRQPSWLGHFGVKAKHGHRPLDKYSVPRLLRTVCVASDTVKAFVELKIRMAQ